MRTESWLTAKRIRIHALLLAVCLWTVYAVDLSTPGLLDRNGLVKGTDFLHFYALGTLALQDRGDLLYDMRAQAELVKKLVPQAPDSLYVSLYGPQVSLFFASFARLPYGSALVAWLALNILIYAFCCHAVWKTCPYLQSYPWTVLTFAIAFPGFFHLLAWGQTSGVALLFFTLAYLALQRNQKLLAGLAIGSLIFKPQLVLAAAVVFILAREWKAIAGALVAASVQLVAGFLHYGANVMRTYWWALTHVRGVSALLEPRLYQTHSLRSFWSLLLPWPRVAFALYIFTAIAVLALAVRCWKSGASLQVRYAALLLATVLVSPHLTVYDLVILAPAFMLLGDWALAHGESRFAGPVQLLLYLCYSLFLLGLLARFTHL
ncbi:MAG TPA: glycosyltransferase family 87 protein, partial [Terriglobales bacterium]|nr:glycosyltransferase family 87 protein [Terriglobales bacterium]